MNPLRGKPTVIDGDPGLGKSMLTLDLTARVTSGSPMPDGTPARHAVTELVDVVARREVVRQELRELHGLIPRDVGREDRLGPVLLALAALDAAALRGQDVIDPAGQRDAAAVRPVAEDPTAPRVALRLGVEHAPVEASRATRIVVRPIRAVPSRHHLRRTMRPG